MRRVWQLSPEQDGLQRAADAINEAAAKASTKPHVIRGQMNIRDVIKYQRAIRRCSAKWHADQVKEEVKNEPQEADAP